MFTLFYQLWFVPLLLALSLLAIWCTARRWKRTSAQPLQPIGIRGSAPPISQARESVAETVSRSLSGMEDHDFQSLHPRSSNLATLDVPHHSAGRSQPDDEDSGEFADLDEDDAREDFDVRESTDRSFDEREEVEPLVFPHPPEPPLVLSNHLLRSTRKPAKHTVAVPAAKSGQHYRYDAPPPIKLDASHSHLPPRIPRTAPAAVSAEASTSEKAENPVLPAPPASGESPAEPTLAEPKYVLAPQPFLVSSFAIDSEPARESDLAENSDLAEKLTAELAEVSRQRDAGRAESARLSQQLEELKSTNAAANSQLAQRQTELQTAQSQLSLLEEEKLAWQGRLADANRRLTETGDLVMQLTNLTEFSCELSARLDKTELARTVAESRMARFQEEAAEAKSLAVELIAERDALNLRLAALSEQLRAEKDQRLNLATAKTMLESSLAALTNQLAHNEEERKRLSDDLDAANRSLEQAHNKQNASEDAWPAADAIDLQAAETHAAALQAVRDESERLRQERQLLLERIAALQSDRTRDQVQLQDLGLLSSGREQELSQLRGALAALRAEAEGLARQLAEQQRPVASEKESAESTEMAIAADTWLQASQKSASQIESLSLQIAEMERAAEEQRTELSLTNLLVSQLQIELQGAEDTICYLEIARDETNDSLEQQRHARLATAASLQEATLALQNLRQQVSDEERREQQMQQMTAERQTTADQLEMVRRDQEVAASERNRFQKELVQAELNAVKLRADCETLGKQVQRLHEEKAVLQRQLETNQQPARGATGDDLTLISGIGKVLAAKLRGAGITTFEQIMNWDQSTIEDLTARLGLRGRIQRDGWQDQAARLYRESQTST